VTWASWRRGRCGNATGAGCSGWVRYSATTAQFVQAVAQALGYDEAVDAARLSPAQSAALAGATPLPLRSLQPGVTKLATKTTGTTPAVGLVLVFLMLTQYNTWILIGVMEEKSSRVIEVLLAAVRPMRLLTGKVLGIGLVALAQAGGVVVPGLPCSSRSSATYRPPLRSPYPSWSGAGR
jgi:ABC-2 type transport system permease protein